MMPRPLAMYMVELVTVEFGASIGWKVQKKHEIPTKKKQSKK